MKRYLLLIILLQGCNNSINIADKSSENNTETSELSRKTEEISVEDKKVVAEIKPISKKKNWRKLI